MNPFLITAGIIAVILGVACSPFVMPSLPFPIFLLAGATTGAGIVLIVAGIFSPENGREE